MVKTLNKKNGFSLGEALVSMLIVSVFFVATSKIMSQKQKQDFAENPHGYVECYYSGGTLYQHKAASGGIGGDPMPADTDGCWVQPALGAVFYVVYDVNSDGYKKSVEPIFNVPVLVKPGEGFVSEVDWKEGNHSMESFSGIEEGSIEKLNMYLQATSPRSVLAQTIGENGTTYSGSAIFISW